MQEYLSETFFWINYIFNIIPYSIIATIVFAMYYKKYHESFTRIGSLVLFISLGILWPFTLLGYIMYKILKRLLGDDFIKRMFEDK